MCRQAFRLKALSAQEHKSRGASKMTTDHHLEARQIALELLLRALLSGMISRTADPIAEVTRIADEFHTSVGWLRVGSGDDHAELMRDLIRAKVDENFDAIRNRVLRDVEIEAANAGKRN